MTNFKLPTWHVRTLIEKDDTMALASWCKPAATWHHIDTEQVSALKGKKHMEGMESDGGLALLDRLFRAAFSEEVRLDWRPQ